MKASYRTEEQFSERSKEAGKKIARLLVDEGLTYREADDALSIAQEELWLTVPGFPQARG